MATAGASALAAPCGLTSLAAPLLALAVLQALYIPIVGAWRRQRSCRPKWSGWLAPQPAHAWAGIHTVPLGLAVISRQLGAAGLGADAPWLLAPAVVCLTLTWVLTLACVGRFLWALSTRGLRLQTLDGAWFLVPAALLGAGMATSGIIRPIPTAWNLLAFGGVLAGWVGYWAVALLALIRVRRFGVGGVAQAPWWIAMGCAGLAAAALGHVLHGDMPGPALHDRLTMAMAATVAFAVVLCVPVVVASARFLLCDCHFRGAAAWPPTFSTAVFAFGCLQAGAVLSSPAFRLLGFAAGCATLVFWAVTSGWNTTCLCTRQLRKRRTDPG